MDDIRSPKIDTHHEAASGIWRRSLLPEIGCWGDTTSIFTAGWQVGSCSRNRTWIDELATGRKREEKLRNMLTSDAMLHGQ